MDTSTRSVFSKWVMAVAAVAILCVLVPASFAAGKDNGKAKGKDNDKGKAGPRVTMEFCAEVCGDSFSVVTTRDVIITTSWRGLTAGPHKEMLALYLPNGQVYQKFQSNMEAATGPDSRHKLHRSFAKVTHVLPVAGSAIQQRNLTGAWSVEVYLDDALVATGRLNFSNDVQ